MKGSATALVFGILGILLILGMVFYIFVIKPQSSSVAVTTGATASPTIPVKDYAPELPMAQKTTIIIMSNDSSEEKYIVPKDQVDTYVKQLPPGYHMISKNP